LNKLENMRKTTINLIIGILIGLLISELSDHRETDDIKPTGTVLASTAPGTPTVLPHEDPLLEGAIAPGLQIVQVPPPLDINGLHPYQCYLNGQPVNIPKEVIKGLLAKHTDTSEKDPNFNVHNFTGNLKLVKGRTRGVVGE
jgi:hypothetical protein